MAESFLRYQGWVGEFEVGDFALIWLVIESALDRDAVCLYPNSLEGRLQQVIKVEHLGEDWYHGVDLDAIVGADEREFRGILAKALGMVRQNWLNQDFWKTVRRYDLAANVLAASRFARSDTWEAFLGEMTRFALPLLKPEADDPLMRSLGWSRGERGAIA